METRTFCEKKLERIRAAGVIAVLVIDRLDDALPTAEALLKGGVSVIELTLRTPAALKALEKISSTFPEMMVGAGTILTEDQAKQALERGAAFGVAPGLNPHVVQMAIDIGLDYAPGIMTPSDIELAVALGCRTLKFFPAAPLGGLNFLKSMAAPYAHLDIGYIPLGGVSIDNVSEYLAHPLIDAVGGSWLANKTMIQEKNWQAITDNARQVAEIVAKERFRIAVESEEGV